MYNLLLPSRETSWGLACAGAVEKRREKGRKGERSKNPSPAVPHGEKGCDSKWCILWQRGNAFIPWAVAAPELSGPGFWLPEEEGVGPWLCWPDEKSAGWEVLSLVDVKALQVLPATGSSPSSTPGGRRLGADDVVVSGSSQVADPPSETTPAQGGSRAGEGWELQQAVLFWPGKRTQARNGWQF